MYSAKMMSEKIRSKRKEIKDDGVENMVDTAPKPQMNPQDIYNNKQKSVMEEITDAPEKSMAPDDPADEDLDGTSQDLTELAKKMARIKGVFAKLAK